MTTDLHSLAAPYALDALEPAERERFEAHLESCPDCQAELGGFFATAVRLGDQHTAAAPPHLRTNVMAAIARTPQERPVVASLAGRSRLRRQLPRLVTVAALLLGVLGLGGYAVERNRTDDIRQQQVAMAAVLGASDATLSIGKVAAGGEVHVMASQKVDAAVMIASGLPDPGAKRTYQLWTMRDGVPSAAGFLDTDAAMHYMHGIDGVDAVAITVEPEGGSRLPTTTPIVTVSTA